MKPVRKLSESSTFWLGLGATALDFVSRKNGWGVDPMLLLAAVLGYAGKEAAGKVGPRPPAPPTVAGP